jgi:hypothetical protein
MFNNSFEMPLPITFPINLHCSWRVDVQEAPNQPHRTITTVGVMANADALVTAYNSAHAEVVALLQQEPGGPHTVVDGPPL